MSPLQRAALAPPHHVPRRPFIGVFARPAPARPDPEGLPCTPNVSGSSAGCEGLCVLGARLPPPPDGYGGRARRARRLQAYAVPKTTQMIQLDWVAGPTAIRSGMGVTARVHRLIRCSVADTPLCDVTVLCPSDHHVSARYHRECGKSAAAAAGILPQSFASHGDIPDRQPLRLSACAGLCVSLLWSGRPAQPRRPN